MYFELKIIVIGLFALLCFIYPCNLNSAYNIKASSIQENNSAFKADNVLDGNMKTRWSSEFSDQQWLEIDFNSLKEIVGMQLFWEAAHGKDYSILISKDGKTWKQIYQTTEAGVGLFDDIYFGKYKTRYFKIAFSKRATSWGYSLWEIKFKGADEEILIKTSSSMKKNPLKNILDADLKTAWHSKKNKKKEWIEIDLRKKTDLGGLILYWSKDYAKQYKIQVSNDKSNWITIFENKNAKGKKEKVDLNIINKRYLRIFCLKSSSGKGYGMKEIELQSWEKLSKISSLEVVRGLTGWQGFKWDTYVGQDGSFAPDPYPVQLGFWIYDKQKEILYTPETMLTEWSLDKGSLPININKWQNKDLKVKTTIFTKKIKETLVYNLAQIEVVNKSKQTKEFLICLKIQPNPLSLNRDQGIQSIEYDGQQIVRINNKKTIFLNNIPKSQIKDDINFAGFKRIKPNMPVVDRNNKAKGLIVYRVKINKGKKKTIEIMVPSSSQKSFVFPKIKKINFSKYLRETQQFWSSLIPLKLSVPDKEIEDCFYASLYYMLIMMDGKILYPGAYAYKTFFLHDAIEMVNAFDKVGLNKVAEKTLELFNYSESDGYQDGMGGSIFGIFDHYRITKDKNYLKNNYVRIKKTCQLIKKKRKPKLLNKYKNTPLYGLLPPAVSQDNFNLPAHLYQDDWWALIGLKCGLTAASILGKQKDKEWMTEEFDSLKKCILDSIKMVMERENIDYMPAFADYWPPENRKKDPDHRILGEAQMGSANRSILFPGQSLDIDIPMSLLKKSFQHYWNVCGKFSGWDGGWFVEYEQVFWGYNAMLAHPVMYVDMEDVSLKSLEWLINNQSCPRGWMEAMFCKTDENGLKKIAKGIIGDVPHGWVAGYYVLLIRNMLIREEDDSLFLLSCVPEKWFENGKKINIQNAPTYFGNISFKVESFINKGFIQITFLHNKVPDKNYLLYSPLKKSIKKVVIDGKVHKKITKNKVVVPAKAKKVKLYY